jgi:long-chain fatty acid transport protein
MKEVQMKKVKILFTILFCLAILNSFVGANGLNLNSLGTKALTMGGAFVGLADDFSAIFWNPAGIVQFKQKYFGFYGVDIIPSGTYNFSVGPVTFVDARTTTKHYLAGLAAYYHPIAENVVAGIGFYTPSGLGAKWDGNDFKTLTFLRPYKWESKVGMFTIAPVLAFKVHKMISVGASLNINYGMFGIKTHAGDTELGIDLGQYEEILNGWGVGATIGILVKPHEKFSIGATVRTPSNIRFSGDIEITQLNFLGMIPGTPLYGADIPTMSTLDRDVSWPWWVAVGVAVRPIENLTLTGDLQWTQWSAIDVMESTYGDVIWSLLVDTERPMHWDDVMQIRFGAEYRCKSLCFRGGYYWDPSPAPDRTMSVLLPSFDFNVLTAGIGYSLDGLNIEFGIEYLMGKEWDVDYSKKQTDPGWKTAQPGIYHMNVLVPNISVSFQF